MHLDAFWVELIGYLGTAATAASFSMRTIVPLRIAAILSSIFFVFYAMLIGSLPMLISELIILPLNGIRLVQDLRLTRRIERATSEEVDGETFTWLAPFGSSRSYRAGDRLFQAGDTADNLLLISSGRFRLVEADIVLGGGKVVGELGFLSPDNKRTMTLECLEDGTATTVGYSDIKQLYFQNPKFGFFLLKLVSERLFQNLARANGVARVEPAA
jgi:hypothetical protein